MTKQVTVGLHFFYIVALLTFTNIPAHAAVGVEAFFKTPQINSMALRPDGKAVLILNDHDQGQQLTLRELARTEEKLLFSPSIYGGADARIGSMGWLDNRYVAIQFIQPKAGIADLIDSKISRRLLILDTQVPLGAATQILSVKTPGWLVGTQSNTSGELLYAQSGPQSRVYRIRIDLLQPDKAPLSKSNKIDGGQFVASNQLIQVDGYATRWLRNNQGEFSAVLHFTQRDTLTLSQLQPDAKVTAIFSWNLYKAEKTDRQDAAQNLTRFLPLALGPNTGEFYCLDRDEAESKSLYLVNYAAKTYRLVYETNAFKIVDLTFSPDGKLIGVQTLNNERIVMEPISGEASSPQQDSGLRLTLDASADSRQLLIYEEAHNQPGQFLLETKAPITRKLIGEKYPWLSGKLSSQQIEAVVNVEGLQIPYLLNLPSTIQKAPLIVMPHGGPLGVFDSPYYDQLTQLFVSQGYAVLRVNFRGSGGRSQQLREAGQKQWGKLMLTDIHTATLAALARNEIDNTRVCLFGISYGGYAASMLLIKHPETYRCGVAIAGVYDVNLHLQSPHFSEKEHQWFKENVGDYQTEYESLKRISPVFNAAKLQKPLLLIHGTKDEIVDLEHSSRFKLALDQADKSTELIAVEGLGHSFNSTADAIKVFTPSLTFLKENL